MNTQEIRKEAERIVSNLNNDLQELYKKEKVLVEIEKSPVGKYEIWRIEILPPTCF